MNNCPFQDSISTWLDLNQCEQNSKTAYHNRKATCETFPCFWDTEVSFCSIEDGGYTYPGEKGNLQERLVILDDDCALGEGQGTGKVFQDIFTLDEMGQFFVSHPKE